MHREPAVPKGRRDAPPANLVMESSMQAPLFFRGRGASARPSRVLEIESQCDAALEILERVRLRTLSAFKPQGVGGGRGLLRARIFE